MRIGEVAVVSYNNIENEHFIKSICEKIEIKDNTICFGRFDVNDQLALHIYGISVANKDDSFSWDLISRKALGYIILVDWNNKAIRDNIKEVVDQFATTSDVPIVVVANIENSSNSPIPEKFFKTSGIQLSPNARLTFGQIDDSYSTKQIMVLLINMLLTKLS